jgi:hypothetical protein
MKLKSCLVQITICVLVLTTFSLADFKYTQQSKVTGGALLSMTKTLGVFSKNARKMDEPQLSVTMLKGNRLRQEHADGQVEIIDLDAKRFVYIDPAAKTYSTMTFEEFKAAMQRAADRAKEEQAKSMKGRPQAQNVKITPKLDMQKTGATKTVLNLTTHEIKMKIDMLMESTDPNAQQGPQSAAMSISSDSWVAPDVAGYSQMHDFYVKMAKELDWLPGTMGGMMNTNAMMGPAMDEMRKNAVKMDGMPLLQYVSMGMSGTGTAQGQGSTQPPPAQQTSSDSGSANPRDAIAKGLGGMFGGLGKKKKQDQDQPSQTATGAPPSQPGSMMDMTVEVLSFSNASLEGSLFDIPAGYTQVQRDPDQVFGGKKK